MTAGRLLGSIPARAALAVLLLAAASCDGGDAARGLIETPPGNGPGILWDPLATPTPEIPFPNDLVTVRDDRTPTGRRVNITRDAPTAFERTLRRHFNELDGFGTFAPITVGFDAALDLNTVGPESVIILEVDPEPGKGDGPVPVDFGAGSFPIAIYPWNFPPHTPHADERNILLYSVYEDTGSDGLEDPDEPGYDPDLNPDPAGDDYDEVSKPEGTEGNGRLDMGEDHDRDGVLDMGNRIDLDYDGRLAADEFVEWYEVETNTLNIRTLMPLKQRTEYVVVLTRAIKGLYGPDGVAGSGDEESIRSPFPYAHHAIQAERIEAALPRIEAQGVEAGEIAFAWTFTTQSITGDLEVIRDGLGGEGPLDWLARDFPAEIETVVDLGTCLDRYFCAADPTGSNPCRDNTSILQGEFLDALVGTALEALGPGMVRLFAKILMDMDMGDGTEMMIGFSNIDYVVFGTYRSPSFIANADGMFDIDTDAGEADVTAVDVPFVITIPKPTADLAPPWPVIVHAHGNPSVRHEALAYADIWARHGYATACIEAVNHGPIISADEIQVLLDSLIYELGEGVCEGLPTPLCEFIVNAVDLLLDGVGGPVVDWVSCFLFGECESSGEGFDTALVELLSTGLIRQFVVDGRATDFDGDGVKDHGVFFTADLFQCRDRMRQTVVDHMQFMRVLKSLDQALVPPAIDRPWTADPETLMPNLEAGDFDADGRLDLGGPDAYGVAADGTPGDVIGPQRYFRTGTSLGGMVTSILMAVEDGIDRGLVNVPGGGLASDIILRSDLRAVVDRVFHQVLGPIVVGEPDPEEPGMMRLDVLRRGRRDRVRFDGTESLHENAQPLLIGSLAMVEGGRLRILNTVNGEMKEVTLDGVAAFSAGIAADKGDLIHFSVLDSHGALVDEIWGEAPMSGLGLERNAPDFRRFTTLGQIAIDPGDPINYARHWFLDPLDGLDARSVLLMSVPGDTMVPINSQIAMARAAGLFGSTDNVCDGRPADLADCGGDFTSDCDCVNAKLIDERAMLGFHEPPERPRYDIDDIIGCAGIGPLPLIPTGDYWSTVRFPFDSFNVYEEGEGMINKGKHWSLAITNPKAEPIDWAAYSQNQVAVYFDLDEITPEDLDCYPFVPGECHLLEE